MSKSAAEAFLARIESDPELLEAAEKATSDHNENPDATLRALADLGQQKGHEVSFDGLKEVFTERCAAAGMEGALSDEMLDAVAGGNAWILIDGKKRSILCLMY